MPDLSHFFGMRLQQARRASSIGRALRVRPPRSVLTMNPDIWIPFLLLVPFDTLPGFMEPYFKPVFKPGRASSIGRAPSTSPAGLAQSVERETLNLKVAGSTPAFGSNQRNLNSLFANFVSFLSGIYPALHRAILPALLQAQPG
ncbi:hypothetical protein N7454_010913 [Penicillium verhagenii]|nr:hypothetical protein N7454_010913 [Penicillium verhagenii]